MARVQTIICDGCGNRVDDEENSARFSIVIDRITDAAGSADDEWVDKDLCLGCLRRIVDRMIHKMDYQERKAFCEALTHDREYFSRQ